MTDDTMREFARALFRRDDETPDEAEATPRNVVPREGSTPAASSDEAVREFARNLFRTD